MLNAVEGVGATFFKAGDQHVNGAVTNGVGGDLVTCFVSPAAECYIYQVPDGVKTKKMLKYYAHELPEKWELEPIGEGSARFLKGDLSSLYGLDVYHTK